MSSIATQEVLFSAQPKETNSQMIYRTVAIDQKDQDLTSVNLKITFELRINDLSSSINISEIVNFQF